MALDRERTERLTVEFGERIRKPIVGGSDAHQIVQYGCIRTAFENDFDTFCKMKSEMKSGRYSISVHPECELKVKNAALIKRALKEIYALGGDYPLWRRPHSEKYLNFFIPLDRMSYINYSAWMPK